MSQQVTRNEMENPAILATSIEPFTEEEVETLTKGFVKFSLTTEGEKFFIWGE